MSRKMSFPSARARSSAPGSQSFQRIPAASTMSPSLPAVYYDERRRPPVPRISARTIGSAVVLEIEAENREAGGVRGEALEASLHDEALDEQEREVPDDDGDEEPHDGRGDPRQVGDPFLQGEERPAEDRRKGDEEGELRRTARGDSQQEGQDDRGAGTGQAREYRQALDDADRRRFPPVDPVGVRLVAEPQVRQEEHRGQDEVARTDAPERESRFNRLMEGDPDDAGGDRGDDDQPEIAAAPPRRRRPRVPAAKQGRHDRGDLGAQEEEDGGQRPEVERQIERQLGLADPEEALGEEQVSRAAHGEELGRALEQPEEYRLEEGHREGVTPEPRPGRAPRPPPSRRGSAARLRRPSLRTAARAPAGYWRPGPAPTRRRRGPGSRRRRSPPAPAAPRSAPPLPPPGT